MITFIAIVGLCVFRMGSWTCIDSCGHVEMISPRAAGCGAAVFLGVICARALV